MKHFLYLAAFVVLSACTTGGGESSQSEDTSTKSVSQDRAIGFNTALPDLKWHLGTEKAIQVVKDFDQAWKVEDYDAMRSFFADTAEMFFPDGKVARSGDEAIKMIKAEDEGEDVSWTMDYAFSVDLDPTRGGEHVQAGYTVTIKNGDKTDVKSYHEWTYVVDGKIVQYYQFTIDGPAE
jgi:hypothetical protein